ncbi:MAG: DUF1697 domain-containing protein [Mycobacteriales bacterium]
MVTHLALLRGINVGGRNRVAMAELRELVSSLGHSQVATYIQSGNVLFNCQDADTTVIAEQLQTAIAEQLGLRPLVVVLTSQELADLVAANPFPDETNPKWLHALVRSQPFSAHESAEIAAVIEQARRRGGREDARVLGRTVFLRTPGGLSTSELAARLARPAAQTTARNWATIGKLRDLVRAP